jgi:hypothetical protein
MVIKLGVSRIVVDRVVNAVVTAVDVLVVIPTVFVLDSEVIHGDEFCGCCAVAFGAVFCWSNAGLLAIFSASAPFSSTIGNRDPS